jgi:hypothetical protein
MGDMFRGLEELLGCLFIILVVSVPLGIWKIVDIIYWLYHHVHISVGAS